jgi:CRP-like cAMP-binding protein
MNLDIGNLGKWRLFANLGSEEVRYLVEACQERTLVGGEDVFHEGDEGDSMWIVETGRVDIVKKIQGDVERVLASFGPGDILGEMTFIDGSRRSATARTAQVTEFLVIDALSFSSVLKERPAVAAAFYHNLGAILASRVRTTNDLYREAVRFNLEVTGAGALSLGSFAEETRVVTVHLLGGGQVRGQILQVDTRPAGVTVVIKDAQDKLSVLPYHAIQRIELG